MLNDELRVEEEPRLEEVAALGDRLHRHNVVVTGCDDGRWLAIFVRDGAGGDHGGPARVDVGANGSRAGPVGPERSPWARSGVRLLEEAEREATRRGLSGDAASIRTATRRPASTASRLEQIGELPGWPSGETTRVFFRKSLTAAEG